MLYTSRASVFLYCVDSSTIVEVLFIWFLSGIIAVLLLVVSFLCRGVLFLVLIDVSWHTRKLYRSAITQAVVLLHSFERHGVDYQSLGCTLLNMMLFLLLLVLSNQHFVVPKVPVVFQFLYCLFWVIFYYYYFLLLLLMVD